MEKLTKDFWTTKYQVNDIGWDIGEVSTPLKKYFDQLTNKNLKILIPGCGNAYEAEYLFNHGFKNITLIDFSKIALDNFSNRTPEFPKNQLINDDFFSHYNTYDLIVEQTFFCAINPELRKEYAKKMHQLLNKNGRLVGLLFNIELNKDKPPFGGNKKEYITYFEPYFNIEIMEIANNSIIPRSNTELFIKLIKK
ncbi:MAG: methyltransferase domain-containing protein [Flavobacteriales bacterium]|nr:methyltransferase domain-containing protein [Flavobacteriales bacterium]